MLKAIKPALLLIVIFLSISKVFAQDLTRPEIQGIADDLLLSKKYQDVTIKKILPEINNIQVVLLDMPYREFPSVIIIVKNKTTHKWYRTFECLGPGITDSPSGLLDWHTTGNGVDFELGRIKNYDFNSAVVKSAMEISLTHSGAVVIPYQNFIHMNTDSDANSAFIPYTIDKTRYYDFANILFDGKYKTYPSNECMMYDSPQIVDCDFYLKNNLYVIKATTNNKQIWIYTFSGVDAKNQYLLNKEITVNKGD